VSSSLTLAEFVRSGPDSSAWIERSLLSGSEDSRFSPLQSGMRQTPAAADSPRLPRLMSIWVALPIEAEVFPAPLPCWSMESIQRASKPSKDAAAEAEAVRLSRLRKDAQRPMNVNLAETIALSHQLLEFAGAARRG
jgi:hypothetical protein